MPDANQDCFLALLLLLQQLLCAAQQRLELLVSGGAAAPPPQASLGVDKEDIAARRRGQIKEQVNSILV